MTKIDQFRKQLKPGDHVRFCRGDYPIVEVLEVWTDADCQTGVLLRLDGINQLWDSWWVEPLSKKEEQDILLKEIQSRTKQ